MNSIKIKNNVYEAEFLPDYGGNCVRLRHLPTGTELLRFPVDSRAMRETPLLYGTPLLIPPNRISGGRFVFKGREYVLPLNEPEHGNHCHGELYRTPVEISERTESMVAFRFFSDKTYLGFPHVTELILRCGLSESGLLQELTVRNLGNEVMPFAAAFHTTFNLAFEGGDPREYALKMPVVREFLREMTDYLPTGEIDENFEEKKPLNAGTYRPAEHFITKFTELNGAVCEIIHEPTENRVIYAADARYKFRHVFNGGSKEFVCIEPQTCRIDGLNVWGDTPEVGIIAIGAREEITLKSSISFQGE